MLPQLPPARERRRLDVSSLLQPSFSPLPQHLGGSGRQMTVHSSELRQFLSLLTKPEIEQMLQRDRCFVMADSFLLATVFVYFKRAGLEAAEFSVRNFWLALYLAHDQEEDEDQAKWELLPWALGSDWQSSCRSWIAEKDLLWRRMSYRSLVTRLQCDLVMAISASAAVWTRRRSASHGGARRVLAEEESFVPQGPELPTPVCVRCRTQEEQVVRQPQETSTDSGMESCSEEEMEIFPME
jgi:speedy protein